MDSMGFVVRSKSSMKQIPHQAHSEPQPAVPLRTGNGLRWQVARIQIVIKGIGGDTNQENIYLTQNSSIFLLTVTGLQTSKGFFWAEWSIYDLGIIQK